MLSPKPFPSKAQDRIVFYERIIMKLGQMYNPEQMKVDIDIPDHSGRVTFRPGRQKNTGSLIFLSR